MGSSLCPEQIHPPELDPCLGRHSTPARDLVRLRREVEDLPTFVRQPENRLHDRPRPLAIAVPQYLVEYQRESRSLFLVFHKGHTNRDQQLDTTAAREFRQIATALIYCIESDELRTSFLREA